jgi:hypothetical protein
MVDKEVEGEIGMGIMRDDCERTEDEFLSRGEHVQGEGDFVLVFFELEPAEEGGEIVFGAQGAVGAGGGGGCVRHEWYARDVIYSSGRLRRGWTDGLRWLRAAD